MGSSFRGERLRAAGGVELASFPGSPEREINTHGEPGIFSHVIKIGPEFLKHKGNVPSVIQPALRSTLGVYDIGPPIVIGASLSEPHTSGTALRKCVNIHTYVLACLRPYTVNFK